ncbi:MAG: extracellular solute-binding protein [Planctomycetota bacterium]
MSSMYDPPARPAGQSSNWLGRAIVVIVVWGTIAAVGWFLVSWIFGGGNAPENPRVDQAPPATGDESSKGARVEPAPQAGSVVSFGIAYGTEKERWLKWAAGEFSRTPEGARIKPVLIPKGSLEGAHEVLEGNKDIHVWSPASSAYRESFVNEWRLNQSADPFVKEQQLALTPMVFVMWKDRYDAFVAKYSELNFRTVDEALRAPEGWGTIAGQPEMGFFRFSHTHPAQSNSGLMTLVLMAYDFQGKRRSLTVADVMNQKFLTWMEGIKRGVTGIGNLSDSTGNLMREMVLRGPSTYDCIFVYESVAIDYLKNAEGRWGQLHVVYPQYNIWNDNPYYVLNVPWSSAEQRAAAELFLEFLMTEPIQQKSLDHGFRPGNVAVPVVFPESPFVRYEKYGLKNDLPPMCENPAPEVLRALQEAWQRAGGR